MEFTDMIKQHMKKDIVYTTEDERLADVVFKMSNAEADIAIVKSKNDIVGVITETDIY
jgi:predicted transcriptional regulator